MRRMARGVSTTAGPCARLMTSTGADIGAVSELGHGLNVLRLRWGVSKRFSEHRDEVGEVCLFDESVWPKEAHQLVFFDETAMAADEDAEKIEALRRQSDRIARPEKRVFFGVEVEGTKCVALRIVRFLPQMRSPVRTLEKLQVFHKTFPRHVVQDWFAAVKVGCATEPEVTTARGKRTSVPQGKSSSLAPRQPSH